MFTQTNYLMPGQAWKAVYRLNSSKLIIVPILFLRIVNVPDYEIATIDEKLENPEGLAVCRLCIQIKIHFWNRARNKQETIFLGESNYPRSKCK